MFTLLFSIFAMAHPLDMAYLQLKKQEPASLSLQLDVHPDNAWIFEALSTPSVGDTLCELNVQSIEAKEELSRLLGQIRCPQNVDLRSLSWNLEFLNRMPKSFHFLGRVEMDGEEKVFSLNGDSTNLSLLLEKPVGFLDYMQMGLHHIGAAPSEWKSESGRWQIPDGIDHILFLLALLLTTLSLKSLLINATGFTLGHSITLGLCLFGVIPLAPQVIEPLVALSIASVAIAAFWKAPPHRFKTTFLFGLIHGCGFAGALGQLQVSSPSQIAMALLGYNIGIELGQLIILILLFPLLYLNREKKLFRKFLIPAIAAMIAGLALFWTLQRLSPLF
jgi:hypothetical protein